MSNINNYSSFEKSLNIKNNSFNNNFQKKSNIYSKYILPYTLIPSQQNKSINNNNNPQHMLGEKKKYNIRKFLTLKEFENIYEKMKKMGLLPKSKNFFQGNKFRAFSSFYSNNLFNNKEINEWAERIEGEVKVNNEPFIMQLKKRIKEENRKNKILDKNSCTMKQIIKCSNIYY